MTAMLDRATEDALFGKYAEFFRVAERERRWNLWNDVPWEAANSTASETLTEAVLEAYTHELYLPDYVSVTLHALRSSRGRAWFVTRWAYEEGKHLLALTEWLLRTGKRTDQELEEFSEGLLARTEWMPTISDPVPLMVQTLAREREEIKRYRALRAAAEAEGDSALTLVCDRFLIDEEAHYAFVRDALRVIQEREPELVAEAVQGIVAATPEGEKLAPLLREELGVS